MSLQETAIFFSESSPLSAAVQANGQQYEIREQQKEMACAIAEAFEAGEHLCVEAPTGVGKSFAYLLPALFYALETETAVLISTNTINLQEQLIKKDVEIIRKATGIDFTCSLAKGRSNYLCLRKLYNLAASDELILDDAAYTGELRSLLNWSKHCEDGDLSSMDRSVSAQLAPLVSCERGNCLTKRCPYFYKCFLFKARRKLSESQLIISNHAFFFSSLAMQDLDDTESASESLALLPDFSAVIFDEGHTLEDVAAYHLGQRFETAGFKNLLNRIYIDDRRPKLLFDERSITARTRLNELRAYAEVFFNELANWVSLQINFGTTLRYNSPGVITNVLEEAIMALAGELLILESRAAEDEAEWQQEIKSLREALVEENEILSSFCAMRFENHAYWFEQYGTQKKELNLYLVPVEIGELLRQKLFENPADFSVIITSATLTVAGDISFYLNRIGLENTRTLVLDSPFDFESQMTLYLGESMPIPDSREFYDEAEIHLKKFLMMTEGRAFVLFTSYSMMNKMADIMESFLKKENFQLYVQGGKHRPQKMLKLFREKERTVLFGTASFWTGVDISGEALSNVIICKLPFSVPDHPLTEARTELIKARKGSPFMQYALPEAILKFRQGFGRLIRSKEDKGIVVIMDSRITSKFYGKFFVESLPKCPIEYF